MSLREKREWGKGRGFAGVFNSTRVALVRVGVMNNVVF